MKKEQVEVQVLVNNKPVKQYWHGQQWWVEARKSVNYEVKLKNNTGRRVLAIASIDGLDVITGKPADNDSGGYIIPAYGSYSIKGFRTSDNEVNLFEFSDKSESYAVESPTGEQSSANCGVIAVRFIEEEYKPVLIPSTYTPRRRIPMVPDPNIPDPWSNPIWAMDMLSKYEAQHGSGEATDWMEQERERGPMMKSLSMNNVTSSLRSAASFDMGTKFSDTSIADKVQTVEFKRGDLLSEETIYYASRKALASMGIVFEPEAKLVLPKAFKNNYCQPPKRK